MDIYGSHLHPEQDLFCLSDLAEMSANKYGKKTVMRVWRDGKWQEMSFEELRDQVHAVARWLIEYGIKSGDHVAIIGENSPEWEATYLGVQAAGAVCIPIDRMLAPSGIRHIIADSGARLLFADDNFLESISELEPVSTLEKQITLQGKSVNDSLQIETIFADGSKLDHDLPKRDVEELAVILYTSGTTGHSKGVMLSARNISSNVIMASRFYAADTSDNWLSILPVHHVFEATAGCLFPIFMGCTITFSKSLAGPDIVSAIRETGVTYMAGVPLVYEKMRAGIFRNLKKKSKGQQIAFNTLLKISAFGSRFGLNLGKVLFKSIRAKAGLSTVRYFLSGGGPLDPEVGKFFANMGFVLFQGYGLSETSPCTHLTPPWQVNHECVGIPVPKVECMILDPNEEGIGEVCVKGPNVFMGYYKNEEATKATFTEDGWFKTGDLGIVYPDSFLQITGRLKAMLVTAGGKNVYPEEIEFYLNRSAYIAESVVVGVPRKEGIGDEVAALIYPDYEQIDIYAESEGLKLSEEDIRKLVKRELNNAQHDLPEYKRIRKFRIFDSEFEKTTKRTIKRFLYTGEMVDVPAGE